MPLELLYAYDFVIIAVSIEELCQMLTALKVSSENKPLRVNMKKCQYGHSDRLWCMTLWYLPVQRGKQFNLLLRMLTLGA